MIRRAALRLCRYASHVELRSYHDMPRYDFSLPRAFIDERYSVYSDIEANYAAMMMPAYADAHVDFAMLRLRV